MGSGDPIGGDTGHTVNVMLKDRCRRSNCVIQTFLAITQRCSCRFHGGLYSITKLFIGPVTQRAILWVKSIPWDRIAIETISLNPARTVITRVHCSCPKQVCRCGWALQLLVAISSSPVTKALVA